MMRRTSRLVALVLLAFVVGVWLVWTAGSHLTDPAPATIGLVPDHATAVSFESESGSLISGWVYSAVDPTAVAVLMHGIRSNRRQMQDRAEHLRTMGISSLVFDFQAHGESPGQMITLGYLEAFDAQAAVRYMNATFPALPVIVIGVSMGGAASVLSKPALDVDVLVLESVYPDVITAISNRLEARVAGGRFLTPLLSLQIKPRAGVLAVDLAPVLEAERVRAATLVLSGDLDPHTTKADTQQLYNSLPPPKHMELLEGAAHVDLERFNTEWYWGVVEPFIRMHLRE